MKPLGTLLTLLVLASPLYAQPKDAKAPQKKLRVLLFADAATREYIFVREHLLRDSDKVSVSIFLQSADKDTQQGVHSENMLKEFPLLTAKPPARSEFDLIIAFDPNWDDVPTTHGKALDKWVREQGGGLIYVAGLVNSFRLARPGGKDLGALIALMPVKLKDSRLQAIHGSNGGGDSPWRLRLKDENSPLLMLDPSDESVRTAWNQYHWKSGTANLAKPHSRGFFSCVPVDRLEPGANLVASLHDSKDKEHPFLVTAERGKGKVVFLASGELWRLRACKQEYHQQIWTNLATYAAGEAGLSQSSSFLRAPGQVTQGDTVKVEIRLVDAKGKAIDPNEAPTLRVTSPSVAKGEFVVTLKSRMNGWFDAGFVAPDVGTYVLSIDAPGKQQLTARVFVNRLKTPFEVHVLDGALFTRQLDLSNRSFDWTQATLELASKMSKANGFEGEAKFYRDAVDVTVNQGWTVRHRKILETRTAMNSRKVPSFRNAHEESKELTSHVQAMRERFFGKASAKETLELLRKGADAGQARDVSLQKAENRLFEAQRRMQIMLSAPPMELKPADAQEHVKSIQDLVKSLRTDAEFVLSENEKYRQTLHELSKANIRPETMRFLQTRSCDAVKQFVDKDLEQGLASLAAVEAMFAKAEFDAAIVRKADQQVTQLSPQCRSFPLISIETLFAGLIQLEMEQAQQTRILAELRTQREAELLKELLGK